MPLFIVSPDFAAFQINLIQQFQSNIQMEDIKNLARLQDLGWSYIHQWINTLKLNTFNLF